MIWYSNCSDLHLNFTSSGLVWPSERFRFDIIPLQPLFSELRTVVFRTIFNPLAQGQTTKISCLDTEIQ